MDLRDKESGWDALRPLGRQIQRVRFVFGPKPLNIFQKCGA